MPHTLHGITVADETTSELSMLCGFDDDLAAQATAVSNRLRGFLTQIHPHLERVLGPRLSHPAIFELLKKYPAPADLHSAGRTKVRNLLKKKAPRLAPKLLAPKLTEEIFQALDEQTVIVAGTARASQIISALAAQLELILAQRSEAEQQILDLVEAHPLSAVIRSMPGVGVCIKALKRVLFYLLLLSLRLIRLRLFITIASVRKVSAITGARGCWFMSSLMSCLQC